jgi:hypothetical protein
MRFTVLTGLFAATLLAGCAKQPEPVKAPPPAKPTFGTFGVDLAAMDKAVKPGDDFYKFVNGKWLETAQIPADKSYYGTVVTVFENTEKNLHAIVDELAAGKHAPGSVDQKVADFYASWMDEAGIEARGLEPAKPYLERIAAAKDKADLMKLVGSLDFTAPFGAFVEGRHGGPDALHRLGHTDRSRHAEPRLLHQQGSQVRRLSRGLPGLRDEGLRADRRPQTGGLREACDRAREQDRAGAWPKSGGRNVSETNNPMDLVALKKYVPSVDWERRPDRRRPRAAPEFHR